MPQPRQIAIALIMSLPTGIGALLLLAAGWLGPAAAVVVWLVSLAGLLLLLYRPLRDVAALREYFLRLGDEDMAPPPELGAAVGGERFAMAVRQVARTLAGLRLEARREGEAIDRLIDNLPAPFLQIDGERRVVRQNRAAAALFGDGALGRDLVSAVRQPELVDAVDRAIAEREYAEVEIEIADPVERYFVCHVVAAGVEGGAGEVLVLLRDTTDLHRSERMRMDFIANASHEIRTPLATLAGCIETLQGPARDDEEAEARFLEIASQQARRMTTLVGDLLSLSRIEVNEHTRPSDPVDLELILQRVRNAVMAGPDGKDAEIDVDIAADLPAVIGADSELEQVFQNLVTNAVRYGGGKVTITAGEVAEMPSPGLAGPTVKVAVSDRGPGIPAQHIPRLTERFYRVDTGRSRELGGTGLGLAIVKHVVNRHGGALQIRSVVGQGSTFAVFLPSVRRRSGVTQLQH